MEQKVQISGTMTITVTLGDKGKEWGEVRHWRAWWAKALDLVGTL